MLDLLAALDSFPRTCGSGFGSRGFLVTDTITKIKIEQKKKNMDATCVLSKSAKIVQNGTKSLQGDCCVVKVNNIAYATLKLLSINHGVSVFLAGAVDYNEQSNKCYFINGINVANNYVVIKMSSPRHDNLIKNEAHIYKLLHDEASHPFIVQLLAYTQCPKSGVTVLVLEHMDMDMFEYAGIRKASSWFSNGEVRIIFLEILSGLSHMHHKGVAHCDLSLENICLKKYSNGKYSIKLMDFGQSIVCHNGVDKHIRKEAKVIRIKPYYDAPELSDSNTEYVFPDKLDVWSLGIILYILLVGKFPWKIAPKSQDLIIELLNQKKDRIDSKGFDLLKGALALDPKERISLHSIADHCWCS